MAQCISLANSTTCPAFNASSVSIDTTTKGFFPFLAFVSDVKTFDAQLQQYITTGYSQTKYQNLLGCSNVNLTNTTNIYARYTQTFLCNAIVQASVQSCALTGDAARSLCADSCAAFAISEETIASSPELCGTTSPNALGLIRADFTTCSLPSGALGPNCIQAASNEPDNCGFSNNLPSLCSYCAASSPNATDSCCLYSGTETRCQGVHLPFTTSMGTLFPSATSQANSTAPVHTKGLSGGQVAGIVVGSILGAILLLALIIGACLCLRRRENRPNEKLNTPSPTRARGGLSYSSPVRPGEPDLPHGARVHQMVALEGSGAGGSDTHGSPGAPYLGSSSGYDDTPESQRSGLGVGGAPKRGGSLSRHSDNGGLNNSSSPNYGSSPEGMASGQSEQMSHFKDYYSTDDIHPGNLVATLWAYQPRANDEWDLERGDMLKIVGIWDDGWATGYKLRDRAEDWETRRNPNRDSGVSNGSTSQQVAPGSAPSVPDGEIKAFPLVCVCLPQHWRKTIESETGAAEQGGPGSPSGSP